MTRTEKARETRTAIAGKLVLTLSPFILLLAFFLIHRWLS